MPQEPHSSSVWETHASFSSPGSPAAWAPPCGNRSSGPSSVHALASPEVYALLVTDRGWTPERYENWLRSILIDQLLP